MQKIVFNAVGVTFDNRQEIYKKLVILPQEVIEKELIFDLVREPDNKHDAKAIKIIVIRGDEEYHLGYIKKELAEELAPLFDDNIDMELRFLGFYSGGSRFEVYGARFELQY